MSPKPAAEETIASPTAGAVQANQIVAAYVAVPQAVRSPSSWLAPMLSAAAGVPVASAAAAATSSFAGRGAAARTSIRPFAAAPREPTWTR